jgi:hypothetical protein
MGRNRLKYRKWNTWDALLFHVKTDGTLSIIAGSVLFALYWVLSLIDQLELGLTWMAAFSILFISLFIWEAIDNGESPDTSGLFLSFLYSMLLFAVVAAALVASGVTLAYVAWKHLSPVFLRIPAALREFGFRSWLSVLAAALTLAVGALFFWFRLRQRFLYGATEAVAGAAVAAHRLSVEPGQGLPGDGGFYFAILTAGVYLVVRGIDNMHLALGANADSDPFVGWAKRWIRRNAQGRLDGANSTANDSSK